MRTSVLKKIQLFLNYYIYIMAILNIQGSEAFFWNWIIASPHEVEEATSTVTVQRDSPLQKQDDYSLRQNQKGRSRAQGNNPVKYNDFHTELCSDDRECPVGKYCDTHYGACKLFRSQGEQCRRDFHCQPGLDCMYGRCLPAVKPGHSGSRCEKDSDCMDGHCCARQHGEKVCKRKLRLGQRCYVPDGGLAYSLNELCPCSDSLVCGNIARQNKEKHDVESTIEWSNRHRLRCVRP